MGRGFAVGEARIPIVPAAILFDLGINGGAPGASSRPTARLGREAWRRAGTRLRARQCRGGPRRQAGRLKGGLGSASLL